MRTQRSGGVFLLAGGRRVIPRGGDSVLAQALQSTGKASPRVAYVGSASGDDPRFFGWMSEALHAAGAGEVLLAPTVRARHTRAAADVLASADLVYVSGGDVEAGMDVLTHLGLDRLLAELHAGGMPVCGTSAGSIILAQSWVRWTDPEDDATAQVFPCLGLASVLCDTHGEGEEWEELRTLLRLMPAGTTGYGIVTGAALAVRDDGSVAALGGAVHRFSRQSSGVEQTDDLRPTTSC